MGLLSLTPASRFVDNLSPDAIESQAQILLAGFFEALDAREVHLGGHASQTLVDLVEKEIGMPFETSPASIRAQVSASDGLAVTPKEAAGLCARRLKQFPQLPNISGGVSFGIDHVPDGPRNSWQLYLHRGPLPLLSLEISDGLGFKSPQNFEESLILSGVAHVVSNKGKSYFGTADSIYLLKKRQRIFPHSRGNSTEDAVSAGLRLRQLCRGVWSEHSGPNKAHRLSAWQWTHKRFMRHFDESLMRHIEAEELSRLLESMGTNPRQWLGASD